MGKGETNKKAYRKDVRGQKSNISGIKINANGQNHPETKQKSDEHLKNPHAISKRYL